MTSNGSRSWSRSDRSVRSSESGRLRVTRATLMRGSAMARTVPSPPFVRILFVNHVPPRRELGAGRVQLELAEEIRSHGHEVDFFAPGEGGAETRSIAV